MEKYRYTPEERKTVLAAKIVGAILIPLLLVPLALVMLLRHCGLFPETWSCAGENILVSPTALFLYVCAAAAYVFGVYHVFKGEPK